MFKKFIERPVLATVISILLVILGILGLTRLPLQKFPDIAPPAVQVTALYPGANAETVLRSVAPSLEESINGVENMSYMSSTASNDGSLVITVYFKLGTDPDQAAVNVQNRVAQATSQLPAEVVQAGISTAKQQNSLIMVLDLYSEDAKTYDQTFLANYAQINIIPEIKRIPGVGQALIFGGSKDYSMRVWLNPTQMAAYNLTPKEVMASIQDKSLEAAPGKFGESSAEAFEYVIKYKGKLNKPEDYENIVIRSNADGSMLRLKDVARIELGSYTYGNYTRVDGKPGINIAMFQLAGSNSNEIQIAAAKLMDKVAKDFPKGVKYLKLYNTKDTLDQSIDQVKHTLFEAFILVFIVVFLFLQDFRSTLIPAIAVPVAILGTFFFMSLLGFSINLLTLFALVLAIGIVVDDAIVVVEAVHAKMEHRHLPPRAATISAMSEITGAIISITLVMSAVFIPIGFMTGSSGLFYKQFAYTLAAAIIISAVNALTLTPALCALLLKNNHAHKDGKQPGFKQRFFTAFNAGFSNMTGKYVGSVRFLARKKWLAAVLIIGTFALAAWLMNSTPKSFVPMEDDNFIAYSLTMPPGTGLTKTTEVAKKMDSLIMGTEAVDRNSSITGFSLLSNAAGPSYAMGFIKLKDPKHRGAIKDINVIHGMISEKLATIKEGSVIAFRFPPVEGYGVINGAEIVLQDRTGKDPASLKAMADKVIGQIMQQKGVKFAYTTFRADYPQLELEVDEERANQLGVDVSSLLSTIQTYFAGDQSLNFNRFGKFYRVSIKADGVFRTDEAAFDEIFVRSSSGAMVPAKSIVTLHKVYGPETISRYNLYNALTINVEAQAGYSNGAIMDILEKQVLNQLPGDYSYEWTGLSLEEKASGSQAVFILLLSLLFVYFLLAAQYESYLIPLAVLLSIPTGVIGAFLGIKAIGLDNNIYVQVGLIMLIGLLAKNAILIVEFAIQRRKTGMSIMDAALQGAKSRLRPIIMTSLAFIVGMVPLMMAKGGSAAGNKSISTGAAFGMLSGVLLGVFAIPLLYMLFQYLQDKVSGKKTGNDQRTVS